MSTTIKEYVKSFLDLQDQRIQAYRQWEGQFRLFLKHKRGEEYEKACIKAMNDFKEISLKIIAIEEKLKPLRSDIAVMIREIQEMEREKLQITTKMQILQKDFVLSKTDEEEEFIRFEKESIYDRDRIALNKQYAKLIDDLNQKIMEVKYEYAEMFIQKPATSKMSQSTDVLAYTKFDVTKFASNTEIRPNRVIYIVHIPHATEKKTIFFIHGMGGRSEQWNNQLKYFSQFYTVVAFDWLGHGKSKKPDDWNAYNFTELIKDAEVVFKRFMGKENYIVGHSLGCALTIFLYQKFSASINKIVLVGGSNIQPPGTKMAIWYFPVMLLEWIRPFMAKPFRERAYHSTTNEKVSNSFMSLTLKLVDYEGEIASKNPMYVTKALCRQIQWPTEEQIKSIKVPTLVLHGEADLICAVENGKKLSELIPNSQWCVIKNTAHNLMLEKPDEVSKTIHKFLTE